MCERDREWEREREGKREKERERADSFSKWPQGKKGWARWKPEVWNSIQSSHMAIGAHAVGSSAAFSDTLPESWMGSTVSAGLELMACGMLAFQVVA